MPQSPPLIRPATPTIGVFDSGFGGLTVLGALLDRIPHANYVFLGDSARLPYGSKSQATVARFAVSSARFLLDQGADLLVIACNTATALALPEIIAAAAPTPVLGVITPGAEAAVRAAVASVAVASVAVASEDFRREDLKVVISTGAKRSGETCFSTDASSPAESALARIPTPADATLNFTATIPFTANTPKAESPTHNTPGQRPGSPTDPDDSGADATVLVLATPATVASGAYTAALAHLGLTATEKACPLFVPLVEEGWTDHPVTAEVARIYLAEALAQAPNAHTLLLGCTHYPLLAGLLARTAAALGHPLHLVDSAQATADAVLTLLGPQPTPTHPEPTDNLKIFATDSVDKFQRLGSHFLGRPLPPVQLVNLGG